MAKLPVLSTTAASLARLTPSSSKGLLLPQAPQMTAPLTANMQVFKAPSVAMTNDLKVRDAVMASQSQGFMTQQQAAAPIPVTARTPDFFEPQPVVAPSSSWDSRPEVFTPAPSQAMTTFQTELAKRAQPSLFTNVTPAPAPSATRTGGVTTWKEAVPQATTDAGAARKAYPRRPRPQVQVNIVPVPQPTYAPMTPIVIWDSPQYGGGGGGGREEDEEDKFAPQTIATPGGVKKPFPWWLLILGSYAAYELWFKKG